VRFLALRTVRADGVSNRCYITWLTELPLKPSSCHFAECNQILSGPVIHRQTQLPHLEGDEFQIAWSLFKDQGCLIEAKVTA
jgi:hypothetical protein